MCLQLKCFRVCIVSTHRRVSASRCACVNALFVRGKDKKEKNIEREDEAEEIN